MELIITEIRSETHFYSTTQGYISIKTNGQVYYSAILTYVPALLYFKYTYKYIYNLKIAKINVLLNSEIKWSRGNMNSMSLMCNALRTSLAQEKRRRETE